MPTVPAWRLRSSLVGHSYAGSAMSICADCSFEWRAGEAAANTTVVRDSNGNMPRGRAGDTATVIKDLKVKGS